MTQGVVVGSGPNGLAAAITLAAAGVSVTVLEAAQTPGGGTRSAQVTVPGLLHDECSGFHPLATDNPFTRRFDLAAHGLRWALPPVQYAHPLDGGRGAAVHRSVTTTAQGLGVDGDRYARVFGPLTDRFDAIATEFLQPMLHLPRHPIALGRFGVLAAPPATWVGRLFSTDEAAALWAGVAAHAFHPLSTPLSSAIGAALGTAAHRFGWPVAVGGSQAIGASMMSLLTSLGGRVETGVTVSSLDDLGDPDIVLLDTAPRAAAAILGARQPPRIARAYRRYRHGPAAFQVAFAVRDGVPWSFAPARQAGTVHAVGDAAAVVTAEREVWHGRMPDEPFLLVGQQYLADRDRSVGDIHPVDVYAHVPAGFRGDARHQIIDQIERFAPGFRERIVATHIRATADITADNANYVAGDIITGANTPTQLIFRPRVAANPYATGVEGVYLCSAATPPGAGAHGMCGWHAARSALRHRGLLDALDRPSEPMAADLKRPR
ncbi:NAD(P)/FAD-dependent oxidoreductase [Gordonia sp. Z-3]|uniref:phytoene desaturase family protein n=1 Tax=Gordonia sp. Z-3 TaxID=3115408 RepID=UPI002E29F0A5|nr:NAD(P)/FAD-dependent oxidoreductase [Gordonia sp. Z-3]MED5803759.1 NAD(P)/FAD-dependent oxidoreductase [Gordonia sp. Z-3]